MRSKYVLIFVLLILSLNSRAQNKIEISTGLGLMELLNVGIYYNLNDNLQTGLKIGAVPFLGDETSVAMTGCFNYYYTGHSELTQQPTWYIHSGINYFRDETTTIITDILFLNLRHGRVLTLLKNLD
jgi:hypothetical protein